METSGNIGPEAKYDVKFEGGSLTMSLNYVGAEASVGVNGSVSIDQLVTAIEAKVGNKYAKEGLELLRLLLKAA